MFYTLSDCILGKYIFHISFDRLYCLATDCLALEDIALEVEKEAVTVEHFLLPGKKIVVPHFSPFFIPFDITLTMEHFHPSFFIFPPYFFSA